jgi:hypothetical protein
MIAFIKRPGAILESGSLIARLTLDDPNQCRTFALYSGIRREFQIKLISNVNSVKTQFGKVVPCTIFQSSEQVFIFKV